MTHSGPDERWMQDCLKLAVDAAATGEVPVGVIILHEGKIVASSANQKEKAQSALHHAEMIALEQAAKHLGTWRLIQCEMYVTLEPCMMCSGAIYLARVPKVTFGCRNPKGGGLRHLEENRKRLGLNHSVEIVEGVLEQDCTKLLQSFFKAKRSTTRT